MQSSIIVICIIIVLLNHFSDGLKNKIFLHVGPQKTGASSVLEFAASNKRMFEDRLCIPTEMKKREMNVNEISFARRQLNEKANHGMHLKSISEPWKALWKFPNSTRYVEPLEACISKKKDIFITSEFISQYSPETLVKLKKALPKDYEIYIIVVYRDWLSKMVSHYYDLNRRDILRVEPIVESLFHNFGQVLPATSWNYGYVMKTLNETMKPEKMILLDFNGIHAIGKDVIFGLFCEILMLPFACSHQERKKPPTRYDTYLLHLVSIVRNYIYHHGFQIKKEIMSNIVLYTKFSRDLLTSYTQNPHLKSMLPVEVSNLRLIHNYASQIDSDVRREYQHYFMHGNRTANLDHIKTFEVSQLDLKRFYESVKCKRWLEAELARLTSEGSIIPNANNKLSFSEFIIPGALA
jgi:hypothetical protein